MSKKKPTYAELQARLEQAEATLEALRRGEIDILIGEAGPLRIRLKALVEENERLAREWQTTFDTVQDAIWVLDADQRILRANKSAEAIFSWPLAEMPGRRCFDIAHHTDKPVSGCPFCLMRVSRQRESFEMQLDERWFEITTDPLVDDNDNLIGAVHIASDITARKRAEEALRESEARFRVAQEMSPDGFTILHPVRNEKGEIVDFTWLYENQAVARINGTDPKDVIGKRLLDLFPTHRGTPVFETYLHVANTGKTQILEEVYVGEVVSVPTWLRLVVVALGEDLAILAHDITGRKQAEEKIQEQLDELRRWHAVTIGREGRVLELKHEVNELLRRLGEPIRYPSAEESV